MTTAPDPVSCVGVLGHERSLISLPVAMGFLWWFVFVAATWRAVIVQPGGNTGRSGRRWPLIR